MVRVSQVKNLAARKRALVAESEIYRQTLIVDFQNLRVSTHGFRSRFTRVTSHPLMGLVPFVGPLLRFAWRKKTSDKKKQPPWLRVALKVFFGFQMYRKFSPVARNLTRRLLRARQARVAEEAARASNR